MRNLVVFSGSSHPALVKDICSYLCISPGDAQLTKFKNGETSVTIKDSVRNKDVYVVQSSNGHVNDMFIELLIMISACKSASAKKVTAILPLFPYSRQPDVPFQKAGLPHSQTQPNTPIVNKEAYFNNLSDARSVINFKEQTSNYKEWVVQTGTLIADLLTQSGADHIITMDLHDPQFQGFFDIPVDNLYFKPLLISYITQNVPNYKDSVVVSPDAGGAKRAISIADTLGLNFALIHKERRNIRSAKHASGYSLSASVSSLSLVHDHNANTANANIGKSTSSTTMLVGDVKDRDCIIIDDLVDTSSTVIRAAKILKDQGAKSVVAIITHGVFSGDAIERIKRSNIDKIVVSNSLPQSENVAKFSGSAFEVIDVSRIFGEAVRRIHNGESVSILFDHAL
ncbi:ribose phosphate diphosphokinase subunit [Saccharomycopsis crataegensis]|uniref:ribose-phosphate diphosphokinase n=1 Tax=Saccharomycopsis crataegensis TaxID=43959 RepID=A0AAV5QJY2_9ASCO|nr:ribose phosphate diphosphokinase subunit [Saccharomycopsis crataegensis]